MTEETDEYGIPLSAYEEMRRETRRHDRYHRWRALKALWLPPVPGEDANCFRDARGDDWTLWRAVRATVGLILDLRWTDKASDRHEARTGGRYVDSHDLAYWDSVRTYGGYGVMVMWLYPGCRVSVFSDGECLM